MSHKGGQQARRAGGQESRRQEAGGRPLQKPSTAQKGFLSKLALVSQVAVAETPWVSSRPCVRS